MDTPICDFVREYAEKNALRLHMPGHKGKEYVGGEKYDITEINGADSLYHADGIIRESEKNAGALFGTETFYSAEGSSLCIRAMLYLALLDARKNGRKSIIYAGRNAHKAFVTAAVFLDFEIEWIYGDGSYLSCIIDSEMLDGKLTEAKELPAAVYVTSPDYLGNISDIEAISKVCRKHSVLLIVDNAHGAYLKFLPESQHPIDLGAHMCCDSAHKTLPVLTGGAYLHLSKGLPQCLKDRAKGAMGLFGSTSPSYLILQSLDMANKYIDGGYKEKLAEFGAEVGALKERLIRKGFQFAGDEPLKLTFMPKSYGYKGDELAAKLEEKDIVCEFSDPDFAVVMLTPEIGREGLSELEIALGGIKQREAVCEKAPVVLKHIVEMSVRKGCFAECEEIDAGQSLGRIFADTNISCPPAVPIVVCGERITAETVNCFRYYGIKKVKVIK